MIAIGARVKATHKPEHDREYQVTVIGARRQQSGNVGTVIGENRGHGFCYEIQFPLGRAWYEPDELEFVESDAAMVRQCCDALCLIATEAREAASAFDYAVGAFTYGKDTIEEKYQRLTDAMADRVRAEARLAGARQLAEALGLIAKVTP